VVVEQIPIIDAAVMKLGLSIEQSRVVGSLRKRATVSFEDNSAGPSRYNDVEARIRDERRRELDVKREIEKSVTAEVEAQVVREILEEEQENPVEKNSATQAVRKTRLQEYVSRVKTHDVIATLLALVSLSVARYLGLL